MQTEIDLKEQDQENCRGLENVKVDWGADFELIGLEWRV